MAVYSNTQLESMGLEPDQGANHEFVTYSDWTTKNLMHAAIKASTAQPNKPKVAQMWRHVQGNIVISSVYCNMGIYIMKISCVVTGGGLNGVDKPLADEYFLCKEEMGVWTLKYLTASEGPHKSNSHLTQASQKDNYSVPDYNSYLPTQVLGAIEKYKALYYTKYIAGNALHTHGMMEVAFLSFKCDLAMEEDEMIDEHVKEVHKVNGISAMTPVQRIEVDTKLEFTLPELQDIELMGPDKRATKISAVYTCCVARKIVTKTNNKNTADVIESTSQSLM